MQTWRQILVWDMVRHSDMTKQTTMKSLKITVTCLFCSRGRIDRALAKCTATMPIFRDIFEQVQKLNGVSLAEHSSRFIRDYLKSKRMTSMRTSLFPHSCHTTHFFRVRIWCVCVFSCDWWRENKLSSSQKDWNYKYRKSHCWLFWPYEIQDIQSSNSNEKFHVCCKNPD